MRGQQIPLSVHPDGWLIKEDPSTNDRLDKFCLLLTLEDCRTARKKSEFLEQVVVTH